MVRFTLDDDKCEKNITQRNYKVFQLLSSGLIFTISAQI